MPRHIELYYDVVCPFAYLASTQIERVAREAGAALEWKPVLLGGILKAIGPTDDANETMSPARRRHDFLDMTRWAEVLGVPLEIPSAHPRRTVLAMRAVLAAGEEGRVAASHALYDAYWVRGEDVTSAEVVATALDRASLDGRAIVDRTQDPAIKQELFDRTAEAVRRGVFGVPTFFVAGEMFWGQDRLAFVANAV